MRNSLFKRALEEASDGAAVKEIEYVFYGILEDKSQLEKAASQEQQEQWELKFPKMENNAAQGIVRIRKTVKTGEPAEYVLTTKVTYNDKGDRIEVGVPTTEAMFDQFRMLSARGMRKVRYFFPVENSDLVFEMDVYLDDQNGFHKWVKVDLEMKNRNEPIPPFPFELGEVIKEQNGERSPEQEALVRKLYDEVFITPNQFIGHPEEIEKIAQRDFDDRKVPSALVP